MNLKWSKYAHLTLFLISVSPTYTEVCVTVENSLNFQSYTSIRLAPANHTLQLANYSQASASCQSALSAECKTASKYELDSQQVGWCQFVCLHQFTLIQFLRTSMWNVFTNTRSLHNWVTYSSIDICHFSLMSRELK